LLTQYRCGPDICCEDTIHLDVARFGPIHSSRAEVIRTAFKEDHPEDNVKLPTIAKLLADQLRDLYSAENQLVKALPRIAKKASSGGLRDAITGHLQETKGHVERLDMIGQSLGIRLGGKRCKAMEGLVEEGAEFLEAEGPGPVIDAAIIAAAQRVEHYEISAYGSARTFAEQLEHTDVVKLLQETLDEESAADERLTTISEEQILPAATAAQLVAGD
jgi:ferritin-like metal-binding protein YciE